MNRSVIERMSDDCLLLIADRLIQEAREEKDEERSRSYVFTARRIMAVLNSRVADLLIAMFAAFVLGLVVGTSFSNRLAG